VRTGCANSSKVALPTALRSSPTPELGFEGIVSKDRARPYRSGPSKTWVKIKNLQAPGVMRFKDHDKLT
jgi:ATP-dependent DNA ligase